MEFYVQNTADLFLLLVASGVGFILGAIWMGLLAYVGDSK